MAGSSRNSLAVRSAVLIGAGAALIAVPFGAGLSAAVMVTGIVVGAVAVALGLAGTAAGGRGTLPVAEQAAWDRGLSLGLIGAGVVFAFAGEPVAAALFGAAGLATLTAALRTRYSVSAA